VRTDEERRKAASEATRRWRERHPEKAKAVQTAYFERVHDDPQYRAARVVRNLRWRKDHPDAWQKSRWKMHLKKRGLTPELYERIFEKQNGLCAICRVALDRTAYGKRSVHLDHDHATGVNRQLLCALCNAGLGAFRDDPVLMRAAADYIEAHSKRLFGAHGAR
jgi:hypothetical protein